MKSLLWLVANGITLALLASCCPATNHASQRQPLRHQAEGSRKTPVELARTISSLAPWSSVSPYSASDWAHIVDAAIELNAANAYDARRAFEIFTARAAQHDAPAFLEVSKAFILLRVMFRFPEKDVPHTGGWIAPKDVVSWGWPVAWRNGRPKLLSPFLGYEGIRYDPTAEYDDLGSGFEKTDPGLLERARLSFTTGLSQ